MTIAHIGCCKEAVEYFGIEHYCDHPPQYELNEIISGDKTFLVCRSLADVLEFILDDDNDPVLILRDAITKLAPQLMAAARDLSGIESDVSNRPPVPLRVVRNPEAWAKSYGIKLMGDVRS